MASRSLPNPATAEPMPDDLGFRYAFTQQYTDLQKRGYLPHGDEKVSMDVYKTQGDGTTGNPESLVVSSDHEHYVRLFPGTRDFQNRQHMAPRAEVYEGSPASLLHVGQTKISVNKLMQMTVGVLDILGTQSPMARDMKNFIVFLQVLLKLKSSDNLSPEVVASLVNLSKKIASCACNKTCC